MENKESGYVYIMSNPCFEKFDGKKVWLKIGKAINVEQRKKDLQTGTPKDFKIEATFKTDDMRSAERAIHDLLKELMKANCYNREFFRLRLESAKKVLRIYAKKELQNLVFYRDGVPATTFDANGHEVQHEKSAPTPSKGNAELFFCSGRDWSASGHLVGNGGFVVCRGSTAHRAADSLKNDKASFEARKACEENGALSGLKFTRDTTFSSPSVAMGVVCGQQSCGLAGWKTKDGRGIRDAYPDYRRLTSRRSVSVAI